MPEPIISPAYCSAKFQATIRFFNDARLNEKLTYENGLLLIDEQDLTVLEREDEAPDYTYRDFTFATSFRAYVTKPDGNEVNTPHL